MLNLAGVWCYIFLGLWRLPCIFSETDSDVLFFLLWFPPLSLMVSADLLYVNSLCWGLSLCRWSSCKFIGCRPLFFFFFRWPMLEFMLAWQIWGLEDQAKVFTCSSSLPQQPSLASCLLFILFGNHPRLTVLQLMLTCPLTGNIKTTFIDLKWSTSTSILLSPLWWWWFSWDIFQWTNGQGTAWGWFKCINCTLYFHYSISSTSEHQAFDPGFEDPYPRGSLEINPSHESSLFYFIESKRPSMLVTYGCIINYSPN